MVQGTSRLPWTEEEDRLLVEAVKKAPGDKNPSNWRIIEAYVPNRSNKDCRKRWFSKLGSKHGGRGLWRPEEDEILLRAIEKHGLKWTRVAAEVKTRNSDQCAKRWKDTLNPDIDRTSWTAEEDKKLVEAVEQHGHHWAKIVKACFPGRTGLAAKNR
ncbi:Homeodomain-like protein, partial [Rhodocollybia butyracea]